MARRDLYEVLGVARNASADELQSVYRKLARHLWWLLLVPIATFGLVLP